MKKGLYTAVLCAAVTLVILCAAFCVSAQSGEYIVKLTDGYIPPETLGALTEIDAAHGLYKTDDISALDGIKNRVIYCEPNREATLIEGMAPVMMYSLAQDELYPQQWQTQMVNADFAWELETYGNGVNVAVIDSGCSKHSDIAGSIYGGYNFLKNTPDYSDSVGHGTHVSGIIAAQHNDFGIAGAAPRVRLYELKCFEKNEDTYVDTLAKAIYAAVDVYDCRIINMSLGISNDMQVLRDAVKYAHERGVIIIAAVGNDGNDTVFYPAGYDEVIGVGSVGMTSKKSYFSQVNSSVFVVAPGENVKSLYGSSSYAILSGTSQSAPLVTAAAAILMSADSSLTDEKFKSLIAGCSQDLGAAGKDTAFGCGLLDIKQMFCELIKSAPYYISPINPDGVLIYNNSESVLKASGIFAQFCGGAYTGGEKTEIVLMPDKKAKLAYSELQAETKFFLWDSLKTVRPLAKPRIFK